MYSDHMADSTQAAAIRQTALPKTNNIDTMLNTRLLRLLVRLGLPAIALALIDELNSLIDAVFMGRYFGSEAVSSVSIILPVILLMVGASTLLSEGTATAASRYLGAKNITKASLYYANTLTLTIVSGAVLGIAFFFLVPGMLSLFDITAGVYYYANIYLRVLSLGLPIFLSVMVLARMVYIEGKNVFLLLTTLLQLALNAAINYLLMAVLRIGVTGAAIGTLLAQLVQIVLLIRYINSNKMEMKLHLRACRISKAYLSEILRLGLPSFVMMSLLALTFGIESRIIADFGSDPLSVQTITGFLFSISGSVASGLMNVSLVIMSYSVGAKNIGRFFSALKTTAAAVFILVMLTNLILIVNSRAAVRIFTDSEDVAALIRVPALIYGLSAPFIFTTNAILYAMQPTGMENASALLYALQQTVLFIPLLFLLRGFGFTFAISAQPTAAVIGGIINAALLPWFIKRVKAYFSQQQDT